MDTRSSSKEQDVDSVCSDDGTNIDNPGEKYTGTPKKSPLVEKSPEETEELSSSESDDTLVESSSESDVYHDVDSESNRSIGEVAPLDTQQKNEIEPDNKVNTSEDSDKHTEEISNLGQYTEGEEAVSHIKEINDDRYADEPAFETNRESVEEAVPPDLSETTSNEDESRDLEVINIPTEEIKGYVSDIIEGACNEFRNISVVDNNNGNEPNRHSSLNDTSLNDYDIVSVDEPTAMGEGASKIEKDLSKDPSIPADISDLTEGESTSPTGDPVIIIDYKKRKFSNDDEDPIFDENERLVDSFVKKLKRDELVEDQQVPEYDSITNSSASCPPGSENDVSDSKEQRDDTSLPNYEDESIQGLDVTVDDTGTPSDDDIKNVEEFVEVVEKENLLETEAQQPPSDVQVDGESYPGKSASGETDELPAVTALVEEDFIPCTGQDDLQSGQQKENSIKESAINVQTDDALHEDSIVDEPGTLSNDDQENVDEFDEVTEKETLLESEARKPSDMPVDSENDSEGTVSGDIEESLVVKAVVESDFSPCPVGDEFQNSKQDENSLNEPVVDVVTDDVFPEDSVEEFSSFTPPEQSSNGFSEPSIIIDYEPKETVSKDNNTKTDEEEKLVDNFVENLSKLNIKDDNTGSDVSSEELDNISHGTNGETTVDDVHGGRPSCEGIQVENQTNDVEENIFEESVGNSDSLREDEKSSSELVNFLSECLDLEDTHYGKEAYSSSGVIDDQSSSEPVQEQFDVEQKLTPEIPKIENFLNEIHDNKTRSEKADDKPNDNELQSNNLPRKYSEEEVRRAIHILTSRPPYEDLDPDALFEEIHDPKFDRVFALVLAPKPKETKTRMFGLFSNPVLPLSDYALPEDLNEDNDNVNNGNGCIDLSDTDDNQHITAENETESESRPDISTQYIIDLDEETMDVEDDDDGDSLSSSSASSGMYVLEEYSAINEELDDEQSELQNNSSNDDESSGFQLPAGSGKMFCVTTISDAPKQDLPHIAESENPPVLNNLSCVPTDSAESPTSERKDSVLSSESDLVHSLTIPKENTSLEKDSVVETEVRIIHLSDDKVEYDEYLLHQAQNTNATRQDDHSQKEDSTNVEQLFSVKEKSDDKSVLAHSTEDDQDNDVEFNVFVESNPRDYLEDTEHSQHVEESVVPTNIQSSAFDPQTVDGIEWETPVESENSEKKYDFSFKVTTPTYITFEENVLPPDYEDRFVTETEVVPSVLDPDENCPFNFDLNDEAESKLINEPQVDVIVLGSDQKTRDESVDRQTLLDSIADILDDKTDEEQSDAESIDSHPPHFVDKQELPMEDPYSTQALAASQPLDLTAYLPDITEGSIICPGGSSFVVVGTPCKTDETIEVQTFVGRSESSPYIDYARNERDESVNSDVGEQLSSSSESLSSTENSDDEDSYGNASDEVPYEQFENDLDYTNEGTQPTIVSGIPLSMSLQLDQLSNPSSSSGNDEEDFTHSFQEGLDEDLQGSSSGRKSSSSSSSCSSNNTAQEPGVSYEYLEEGNDDDPSQSNLFESKETTPVNRQESHEVPGKKDEHAIKAEDPEDLDNIHFQVLLESETPRWYEDPVNDNLVTSDSDSIEPIVMTVYHDQQPLNSTENNECKLEEHIDSHREKETESVPLIPNEHVTFNMYLEKPPLEESPVEYDEYLEFQPKDGSENLSEPEINDTATDQIEEMGEEIDESTFVVPKEDVVLSDTRSKDPADPEQPFLLTSDSDDVTPPRHRPESSSAGSSFSDSDVQEEPSTNGASVVFALIGRPSLDNLHDPLLSDDHSGQNFERTPELRDEDGSPEPPVVFQGSVEVFRDESLDEVQVGSVTNFQEVCHNNEEDERELPDSEISQQSIVYYTESETHIVHQSITTIEVSRSMSPS